MTLLYITSIVFILVVSAFTWYTLDQLETVEKLLFIAIGLTISTIITTVLFNIAAQNIEYPAIEMMKSVRKVTVFAFMPINAIAFMPFIGKQMSQLRFDEITKIEFAKRVIILIGVLLLLVIFEDKYLIDMQKGILDIMNQMA